MFLIKGNLFRDKINYLMTFEGTGRCGCWKDQIPKPRDLCSYL